MDAQKMVRLIRQRGINDSRVLTAMETVPRDKFVPEQQRRSAYGDHALSIGCQQTISQPYIVALMSQAMELQPGDRVLEIGTGSGYQAAILAAMGMDVYTVERIQELCDAARQRFKTLGYEIHQKLGDGYFGWSEFAPYAGIIVTAAPAYVPPLLLDQLANEGHLIVPIGPEGGYQTLWKFTRRGEIIEKQNLGGVVFVPFVTGAASE